MPPITLEVGGDDGSDRSYAEGENDLMCRTNGIMNRMFMMGKAGPIDRRPVL